MQHKKLRRTHTHAHTNDSPITCDSFQEYKKQLKKPQLCLFFQMREKQNKNKTKKRDQKSKQHLDHFEPILRVVCTAD